MEIKLKSGRKLKIKDISLDDRDSLLDSIKYDYKTDGSFRGVTMMHSTMTKWLRTCLDGNISDEFLMGLSLEDKTETFTKLQEMFFVGEKKASK